MSDTLSVLTVNASARRDGSVTRKLVDGIVADLGATKQIKLVERDVAQGLPIIDEVWVGANFTDPAERSDAQRQTLALSDELVAELKAADVLVIGVPVYNFGVPAALKAWIDLVTRARETFHYTEDGPVGLLEGKKAVVVMASGGVPVGSPVDFATGYLRHILGFIGIKDVEIVAADRLAAGGDEVVRNAEAAAKVAAQALAA
ncbi:NAD(P)H-dependent oxidoreductase [Stappia sp. F7233]|uniref:FMN dependent NADH:quinone oxidoreductase n=1 Tax=Stappia albiluteola TaxID=2758565 RepID=A0A839AFY1_9HYPH|nr:NAD(P)H-dependent oxidoreductase [Stappia albiluteola]MBA5777844.1 NAD(P)H-dependent oxidoreductase [Stappia albiluteola]